MSDQPASKADDPAGVADTADSPAEDSIWDLAKTIFFAVLIAIGFRTIAYEPFNIPSESMLPTLKVGDYLFVSKAAYGYSNYSLPFSPQLFSGRILADDVTRGDVAVFKLPRDNKTDYIKRIIGLPGDRIQMRNGRLYINRQPVERVQVKDHIFAEAPYNNCDRFSVYRFTLEDGTTECRYPQYRETLPNGVSYLTLDLHPQGTYDNTREYLVPDGHYFAMGDNRDNSKDSRLSRATGVGFVPVENLVGRAEVIFFSTDGRAQLWEPWYWIQAARGSRLFSLIR